MASKTKIKINFTDFWSYFKPTDNYFWRLLSQRFDLELSDNADFLICSVYGRRFRRFNCHRIQYVGEVQRPDYREVDHVFATCNFPADESRRYRLPNFVLSDDLTNLTAAKPPREQLLEGRDRFCNFIFSNPRCVRRNEFFHKLCRYKKVDAGGRLFNNIGGPIEGAFSGKREFMKRCRFTICFENEIAPGWVTEKLFEALLMGTVPIYWGAPDVANDFNPKAFLNWHDYGSDEALIQKVVELEEHPEQMLDILEQPGFIGNQVPPALTPDAILDRFEQIFTEGRDRPPVAHSASNRAYSFGKSVVVGVTSGVGQVKNRVVARLKHTFRGK